MTSASWLQTASGRKVYPLDLQPDDICIEDIAHHLSNLCRFTGAVKSFYSVAQHSCYVSAHATPRDALWGLLHDASEAYLVDVPRPLKQHPSFAFYREAEARAMATICAVFNLPREQPASVTIADERILATEARDLMAPLHKDWRDMKQPYKHRIEPWSSKFARDMFLERFRELRGRA